MTLCFIQWGLRRNIQPQPLIPICMCGAWRKAFKTTIFYVYMILGITAKVFYLTWQAMDTWQGSLLTYPHSFLQKDRWYYTSHILWSIHSQFQAQHSSQLTPCSLVQLGPFAPGLIINRGNFLTLKRGLVSLLTVNCQSKVKSKACKVLEAYFIVVSRELQWSEF